MIVNRTRGQWHWENPASVEMILGILVDVMEVFAPRIPRDERLTRNDIFIHFRKISRWKPRPGIAASGGSKMAATLGTGLFGRRGGADGTAPGNKQAMYFCNIL